MPRAGAMRVEGVWRFFRAASDGNRLTLLRADGSEAARFDFPRQRKDGGLCLADYVLPPRGGRFDHVAAFVTTAGAGIRDLEITLYPGARHETLNETNRDEVTRDLLSFAKRAIAGA